MKRLLAILLATVALLILAAPVSAHALFVRSDPAPNALLNSPPVQVEIWLTEPVEAGFTEVKVLSSTGTRVDVGDTSIDPADPMHVSVGLRSLADGVYTVSWQALSVVDGHITLGTFPFAVGAVDAQALAAAGSATTSVVAANPGEIFPRWLAVLSLALVVGGYVFRAYVWSPSRGEAGIDGREDAALTRTERSFDLLRMGGLALFLAAHIGALLWQVTIASGLPTLRALLNPALADLLFGARFGLLWLLRTMLVLVLAISDARLKMWLQYARPVAAGGALLTLALGSHPAAAPEPFLPVLATWLHFVMATIWIGGLVYLLVGLYAARGLRDGSRAQLAAALVPRFSNVGLATVGMLVVTGVYNATVTVMTWDALFTTDYGRALLMKLALLAPLLALAAVNLFFLRPRLRAAAVAGDGPGVLVRRLRRTVAGEALLGCGLLLMASVFAATPPAESLGGRLAFDARAEDLRLDLTIRPGTVGFNGFELIVADENRQPLTDAREVALRFTPLSGELAPSELPLTHAGAGRYVAEGGNLSLGGGWQVQAVVRRAGEFDAFANFDFEPATPGRAGTGANRPLFYRYSAVILLACAALYLMIAQGLARNRAQRAAVGLLPAIGLGLASVGAVQAGIAQVEAARVQVNPIPPTQESIEIGMGLYAQHCLPCHGPSGLGDGPAGLLLNPPPADLQQHMIPGVHTDGQIFEWISDGFPQSAMLAFAPLLTEGERWHVLNYIRTFVPEGYE